ncbi:MAG: membrane protein insertase YidC [Legionellales bacterium]|nr:membrane protein insertase YidC [Legionellales bacterium]|tara:strand:- start:3198 stop:4868 length:1671 start_codon:yes stop_codon:yes gene_type:complete
MQQSQLRDLYIIVIAVMAVLAYQQWFRADDQALASKALNDAMVSTVSPSQLIEGYPEKLIEVETDVFQVFINPVGGEIVDVKLLKFEKNLGQNDSVEVLYTADNNNYIAAAGIGGVNGSKGDRLRTYSASETYYKMGPDGRLIIELTNSGDDDIVTQKRYHFVAGSYAIGVETEFINQSDQVWEGRAYEEIRSIQVLPKEVKPANYWPGNVSESDKGSGVVGMKTYAGASFGSEINRYKKLPYADIQAGSKYNNDVIDWVAIQQKYFLTAWIPSFVHNGESYLYTYWINNSVSLDHLNQQIEQGFRVGAQSRLLRIEPDHDYTARATLYVGPEDMASLKQIFSGLELTVDYGWLWLISQKIFLLLEVIHDYIPNWGLSIITITVLIKLLFYKLSSSSYRSMARLKELKPRLDDIQERYKDDAMAKNQAMVELYRNEKVNPLGGCLPMLIQIPIFMSLYFVLIEAIQLRHADFLWITDLSTYDPLFILPVLMGASMYLQQRMSPQPSDPVQAKMMMVFPVVLSAMFAYLPSGLVLYWFVNNVLSLVQQYVVTRQVED